MSAPGGNRNNANKWSAASLDDTDVSAKSKVPRHMPCLALKSERMK